MPTNYSGSVVDAALLKRIKQAAADLQSSVVGWRRYLHQQPELSFKEYNSAAFVKAKLDEWQIAWQPIAGTGVLATLQGKQPGNQTIALRADLDALPIQESNTTSYASASPGIMHACGHDAHTASLLGTAAILQNIRDDFGGTVKLLFQPSEEVLPGGAGMMIAEGALSNPVPASIIGQHVSPALPVGKIGIRAGKFMASMDEISLLVKGRGGHGAQPHLNIDPVMITAQLLTALQQVVSRRANPFIPTVLSFGKIEAKGAFNIIPNEVFLQGTFRTFDEEWREEAHRLLTNMAIQTAQSMGGECMVNINKGYPYLVNDEAVTKVLRETAIRYLGRENVVDIDPWMAAEDFARYSHALPACFYLLGIANEPAGITASLHSPAFDIDEASLAISTGLMACIAIEQLSIY
ncbi:MAG: M20 family metallopeptidase [Bacteroidetes bacterium]|nr:M20 family metallopeptidase [Bacteroidota bacterium]